MLQRRELRAPQSASACLRGANMSNILESARNGRVLRLALNRPEKRNALSSNLCLHLTEELERAASDPAVGAILLTGKRKSLLRRNGSRRSRRP